jgi:hypothetical protein
LQGSSWRRRGPDDTGCRVLAVVASVLVLVMVVFSFVESHGIESLLLANGDDRSDDLVHQWISLGASFGATRSIGLFLALGGGLLGLTGGILALRKPRPSPASLLPPPPVPSAV